MTIDPSEHETAELTPKVNDIDTVEELEAILEAEKEGEDRMPVKTVIENRIEDLQAENEEVDPAEMDLAAQSTADIANLVRDIDDVDVLEDMVEREQDGEDRNAVIGQIESRIESIEGSDEEDSEQEIDLRPPEEKYPDLDHPTADKQWVKALEDGDYRDMWVYCETQQGQLLDVSKEMLGKARELMEQYNEDYAESEDVVAVVIGDDIADLTEECVAYGADRVIYLEDERLERFRHTPYTEIFCDMARNGDHPYGREERPVDDWREYDEPRYTVFPATNNGRDLSALVQGELDSGLASDCSDLFIEEAMISNPAKTGKPGESVEFERVLHMKRPDFSGFEYSTILCLDKPNREFHPQGASVIPGTFDIPEPDHEREGEIVEHEMPLDDDWFAVEVTDYDQLDDGVDLTGNEVVVALGRGIGDDPTRGIELGLDLVEQFEEADLGLSRGVITASYQFGGHVDVYIAAGISGAVQHRSAWTSRTRSSRSTPTPTPTSWSSPTTSSRVTSSRFCPS